MLTTENVFTIKFKNAIKIMISILLSIKTCRYFSYNMPLLISMSECLYVTYVTVFNLGRQIMVFILKYIDLPFIILKYLSNNAKFVLNII